MTKTKRTAKPAPIPALDIRNFAGRIVDTDAVGSEERGGMIERGEAAWMTLIDGANHVDRLVRTVTK